MLRSQAGWQVCVGGRCTLSTSQYSRPVVVSMQGCSALEPKRGENNRWYDGGKPSLRAIYFRLKVNPSQATWAPEDPAASRRRVRAGPEGHRSQDNSSNALEPNVYKASSLFSSVFVVLLLVLSAALFLLSLCVSSSSHASSSSSAYVLRTMCYVLRTTYYVPRTTYLPCSASTNFQGPTECAKRLNNCN